MSPPITRRRASALIALSALLLGGTAALAEGYREAPSLSEKVKAGALPPVEQRLPKNPRRMAVPEIGRYGGTWRTAARGRAETWTLRTVGYDHLVAWKPDWSGVEPNVLAGYEANADSTVYTLKLREGMRWSDGHPFTADDLLFAYENVFRNKDLGGMPPYLETAKGPGRVEKIDDLTVRVTFPEPNAFFLEGIAQVSTLPGADAFSRYPAHYMRQFHPVLNAGGVNRLVAEAGVKSATELFERRADTWTNPQKPTLNAWLITVPYGQGTRMVAERNPYYFKVDTAGNQLPYIDRVAYEIVQDDQVLLLKVLAGEIDMHSAHVMTVENRAVIDENKERGNYRFVELLPSEANDTAYMLNLTHKDPVLREVFSNKKFRMALSHAIDRQAVNDQVFVGQSIIMQPAIRPDYPLLYSEKLAKQFTEYDVAAANRLLDEAGYARKDARGMRIGPDGKPISFGILTRNDKKFMVDTTELLVHYFKQVGIDARLDVAERSLVRQRVFSGQFDMNVEDLPGGKFDAFLRPQQLLPMHHNAVYGVQWYQWFIGKGGEEPPPPVKRQFELWRQVNATTDQAKRVDLMKEIIRIAEDNFFLIGIGAPSIQYGIVSRRLRNVPEKMEGSYWFAPPGPNNPPTWFFADAKG